MLLKHGEQDRTHPDAHHSLVDQVLLVPLAKLLADRTGAQLDRGGRIAVLPDLTVPGHPEVFVIGDMAPLPRPRTEKPCRACQGPWRCSRDAGRRAADRGRAWPCPRQLEASSLHFATATGAQWPQLAR